MTGFGTLHARQACLVWIVLAIAASWLLARLGLRVNALLVLGAIVAGVVLLNLGSDAWTARRVRHDLKRLAQLALAATSPEEVARGQALVQALARTPPNLPHLPEFEEALGRHGPLQLDCVRLLVASSRGGSFPYFAALESALPVLEPRDFEPLVDWLTGPSAPKPLADEVAWLLGALLAAAPASSRRDLVATVFLWAPDQPGPAWVELFRPLRAELVALKAEPKTPYLEEKAATYLKAVG